MAFKDEFLQVLVVECALPVVLEQEGLQLHDGADGKGFEDFFDGLMLLTLFFDVPFLEVVLSGGEIVEVELGKGLVLDGGHSPHDLPF